MNQEQTVYDKKLTPAQPISYAKDMGEVTLLESTPTKEEDVKEAKKGNGKGEKVSNQKTAENNAAVLAKRNQAENAWKAHYAKQGKRIEDLGYAERQTIRQAVQEGWAPAPHESTAKIDTNTLPSKLPPEVRQVITTANELLDLIPAQAYAQQMATLEQSLLKLSTLDISEEMRDEVRGILRNAVVAIYENGNQDETSDKKIASRVKPAVHEVLGNSLLSDENRLVKAEEVLQEKHLLEQPLSEEQKAAILEAHYVGQGERGKDAAKTAGVYNYTREQLRQKAEILDRAGFSKDQRRALIEAGIAAEPIIDTGVTDPGLAAIVTRIRDTQARVGEGAYPLDFLDREEAGIEARIAARIDVDPGIAAQAKLLLDQLATFRETAHREQVAREQEIRERTHHEQSQSYYLTQEDKRLLATDPTKWLNDKFDQVFTVAVTGQTADSAILGKLNQQIPYVLDYMVELKNADQGVVKGDIINLNRDFFSRIHSVIFQSAIETGNPESMAGAANRIKAEGVGSALSLDDGGVRYFFNRMYHTMEDIRLRNGGDIHHINPEMLWKMQADLMEEQVRWARNGIGVFANAYKLTEGENDAQKELKFREQLLRSERTATALFIGLGELAIINSRGKSPENVSDVGHRMLESPGDSLAFFNLENNMRQYKKINHEESKFLDAIKLQMADSYIRNKRDPHGKHDKHHRLPKLGLDPNKIPLAVRMDLGRRLFRDIVPVAGLFDSSWRTDRLKEQLADLFIYKEENNEILTAHADAIYAKALGEKKNAIRDQGKKARKDDDAIAQEIRKLSLPGGILHFENRNKLLKEAMLNMPKADREVKLMELGLRDEYGNRTPKAAALEVKAKKRSEDFAMFMRLNATSKEKTVSEHWEAIGKYRTEEIIRLFRERGSKAEMFEGFEDLFARDVFRHLDITHDPDAESKYKTDGQKKYDEFKRKYGAVIQLVREQGWNQLQDAGGKYVLPEQTDFANLSPEQKALVDDVLGKTGEGENLQKMFAAMQQYIGTQTIGDWYDKNIKRSVIDALQEDDRFADVSNRALVVDDTFLDELEVVPANSDMISMSRRWSSQSSKDAVVRMVSDYNDGIKLNGQTKGFITNPDPKGKIKDAMEAGPTIVSLNGPTDRAKYFRYTIGSLLELSKVPWVQDVLGLKKLWFEISSSKIQDILGPHADPMLVDELRYQFNEIRGYLVKDVGENEHDAEEYLKELEESLGITAAWQVRKKFPRYLAYILLGLFGDILGNIEKTINEK